MLYLFKLYYGDYGENAPGTGGAMKKDDVASAGQQIANSWPLWEVFIRSRQGLDHKHAGSLHAVDAKMAIENARDVYCRRMEGVSIWVVESKHIHASNPDEAESLYDPADDKIFRYPTFYPMPEGVKNI
ncbi:MAG TPA: 1,2-phenylacetyl-CoA epoxidase subunit PaaB [Chitinophagaceae bacterium]|nr:1,2-phenylacetyl-CoA epoxidase subunit PaaB [Chitinophagaceae bacterium]